MRGIVVGVDGRRTKRRYLDDLAAETDVRKPEAAADEPAVREQRAHLLGRCVGRNVEVLGVQTDQCVTHTAAHEECLVARLVEPIQHLQRTV